METWQWVFVQDNKDTGGQDSTKTNKQKQSTLSGIMGQWEKKISPLGKMETILQWEDEDQNIYVDTKL